MYSTCIRNELERELVTIQRRDIYIHTPISTNTMEPHDYAEISYILNGKNKYDSHLKDRSLSQGLLSDVIGI